MKRIVKGIIISLLIMVCPLIIGWSATYDVHEGESIQDAIDKAEPGDTVLVHEGVYRESVLFNTGGSEGNPILLKAQENEEVVLEGTTVISGWQSCTENDAGLMILGQINPYWADIYWTIIDADNVPLDPTELVLFEDSWRLKIARTPTQTKNWGRDVTEFVYLEEEAWNHDDGTHPAEPGVYSYLIDSDYLTQPDDYWNGAYIDIYLHAMNANTARRIVSDYSRREHKVVFDEMLDYKIWYGSTPDSYSFVNHPHSINSPGEFLIFSHGEDKYKIYILPQASGNISDNITATFFAHAVRGYRSHYVTVDGFEIRGYQGHGIYFRGASGNNLKSIQVKNCYVHDVGGTAIYFIRVDHGLIENCTINRGGNRGAMINNGNFGVIRNNYISNTNSTNMSFYGMHNGMMIGNTVTGSIGDHGNGSSCYLDCTDILVAGNYYISSNMAFNELINLVVFNNVMYDAEESSRWLITPWSSWYDGYQVYMHNTLEGSYAGSMLANTGSESNWSEHFPDYYIANNIFDGLHSWTGDHIKNRSYNAYTSFAWDQREDDLGSDELDLRETSLTAIFIDPENEDADFGLSEESPVRQAGVDIIPILDSLGVRTTFPHYDFTKDINGNTWADPPSMGCSEYGSSLVITQPGDEWNNVIVNEDINPESNHMAGVTRLNVYNNIFKPSENKGVIISCNIHESADLSVILYNSMGKKIKIFYNGYINQDIFSVTWYGEDDNGRKVGAGIYIVHMKIGNFEETKKIAVIK